MRSPGAPVLGLFIGLFFAGMALWGLIVALLLSAQNLPRCDALAYRSNTEKVEACR